MGLVIGAGTNVAIESAYLVLIEGELYRWGFLLSLAVGSLLMSRSTVIVHRFNIMPECCAGPS